MESEFQIAYYRACKYCATSEKCKSDVLTKLYQWKINSSLYDKIISKLVDEEFINEERFVKAFVEGKFNNKKWGKLKIKHNLLLKKIDQKLIDKYIYQIKDNEYFEEIKKLSIKKLNTLTKETDQKKKQKTIAYLLSKGYQLQDINVVLNKLIKINSDNDNN